MTVVLYIWRKYFLQRKLLNVDVRDDVARLHGRKAKGNTQITIWKYFWKRKVDYISFWIAVVSMAVVSKGEAIKINLQDFRNDKSFQQNIIWILRKNLKKKIIWQYTLKIVHKHKIKFVWISCDITVKQHSSVIRNSNGCAKSTKVSLVSTAIKPFKPSLRLCPKTSMKLHVWSHNNNACQHCVTPALCCQYLKSALCAIWRQYLKLSSLSTNKQPTSQASKQAIKQANRHHAEKISHSAVQQQERLKRNEGETRYGLK